MRTFLEDAPVAPHPDEARTTPPPAAGAAPSAAAESESSAPSGDRTLATGIRASIAAALTSLVLLGVALIIVRHGAAALADQPSAWQADQLEAERERVMHASTLQPAPR